jgi:hypothetical protein
MLTMQLQERFDMDMISKFLIPILLFVLTLVFGFWMSRLGKPYNGALFNIHKLIALGAVVFAAIQINKTGIAGSPLLIAALVLLGLCIVALFVSGAFLSIGNVRYETVKLIHNIAPVLAVLAIGSIIYLLSGRVS